MSNINNIIYIFSSDQNERSDRPAPERRVDGQLIPKPEDIIFVEEVQYVTDEELEFIMGPEEAAVYARVLEAQRNLQQQELALLAHNIYEYFSEAFPNEIITYPVEPPDYEESDDNNDAGEGEQPLEEENNIQNN